MQDLSCALFNFGGFKKIGEDDTGGMQVKTSSTKLASFNQQKNRESNFIEPYIPNIDTEKYPQVNQCIEKPQSPLIKDDLRYINPEDFNKTVCPQIIESFVVD